MEYDSLLRDLENGHEIEFVWNDIKISIHCKLPQKWYFTIVGADITFEFNSVHELLKHISFRDGKSFSEILGEITDYILY
mgnify:CR=1 FL=1